MYWPRCVREAKSFCGFLMLCAQLPFVQTLPIVEKMYPNHWLCNDHPIYHDDNRHVLHDEHWEAWAALQWKV